MKKKSMTVLFALVVLTAGAQSKLDLSSRLRLQKLQQDVEAAAKQSGTALKAASQQKTIKVTVCMKDGVDAGTLAQRGFDVTASRGEVGVVSLPLNRVAELDGIADVATLSYGEKVRMKLSEAHKQTGVDKIHSGEGLELPYTGKGVLIADIDGGFDPNHAFFLDKDGKTRVKYYIKKGVEYTDPDAISAAGPDYKEEYHAAHVLGIAAGYFSNDELTISGVAPEADIAMGSIVLGSNEEFIEQTEKMISRAKELNEPLVMNYSIGINNGPHDNTCAFNKYLNNVIASNDAVVCMAAGNEGLYPIVQKKTFTADTDSMTAYMYVTPTNLAINYNEYSPTCTIYGDGTEPFEVSFVLYNLPSNKIVKIYDPSVDVLSSKGTDADADFAKYFQGTLVKSAGVQEGRDRYYTSIAMSDGKQRVSSVIPGYIVKAKNGRTLVCYADQYTYLVKQYVSGKAVAADGVTYDGTINNYVTGMDGISVASYNSRVSGKYSTGQSYSTAAFGEANGLGDVSSFSSWGTVDGVNYPDIAAPGALIESAVTSAYLEYYKGVDDTYTSSATVNGTTHYWTVSMGTSMATPYMSGVAALWLQADPTLTTAKIKEIAKSTAIQDDMTKNTKYPVQFGAGKIDAYNGLKKVLEGKSTGLRSVDADKDMLFRSTGDNSYEAYVAGETAITVNVYDMSGRRAYSRRTAGNSVEFSLASLPKGIYAVELCGSKTSHKVKVAVK